MRGSPHPLSQGQIGVGYDKLSMVSDIIPHLKKTGFFLGEGGSRNPEINYFLENQTLSGGAIIMTIPYTPSMGLINALSQNKWSYTCIGKHTISTLGMYSMLVIFTQTLVHKNFNQRVYFFQSAQDSPKYSGSTPVCRGIHETYEMNILLKFEDNPWSPLDARARDKKL